MKHVHVASLSQNHVVYKVMGAGDILPRYYQDLANPLVASTMTLGHNRYSTIHLSSFFRVQPFSVLGHNGEINTIAKLRDEARMIGVPLVKDGSDSQDLSRTMETLICRDGYTLFEAMDVLFPPIINEIKAYPETSSRSYILIYVKHGDILPKVLQVLFQDMVMKLFLVSMLLDYVHFGCWKQKALICFPLNQESFHQLNM